MNKGTWLGQESSLLAMTLIYKHRKKGLKRARDGEPDSSEEVRLTSTPAAFKFLNDTQRANFLLLDLLELA